MYEKFAFEHKTLGKVRTWEIGGEPWFVGRDVAAALGYKNTHKAVREHVDEEDQTVDDSYPTSRRQPILVNKSGMYSLILASKLESARGMQRKLLARISDTVDHEDFFDCIYRQ